MKKILFALASIAGLAGGVPAEAALTDYSFSGALVDGTKFDGAFTLDDSKVSFEQLSNYHAKLGGVDYDRLWTLGTNYQDSFFIGFSDGVSSFNLGLNARGDMNFKILDLVIGDLDPNTTMTFKNGDFVYGSGTLSLVNAAAVPEPATWALMILGFGVVGYAMRRRPKAVVRFA